jgi:hypothetical protein
MKGKLTLKGRPNSGDQACAPVNTNNVKIFANPAGTILAAFWFSVMTDVLT